MSSIHILIFEDRFTKNTFDNVKKEVETYFRSEKFEIELQNYRYWEHFFIDFDNKVIDVGKPSIVFLDHLLQDNDTFNRDGLSELSDGFSSYSFFNWLNQNDYLKNKKIYGISSIPQKQNTFLTHIPKSTVLFPENLIEFLKHNL